MDKCSFGVLFGPYLPADSLSGALSNGVVESMDMNHSTRCMEVSVRFEAPVESDALQRVENHLVMALRINGVTIHPHYPTDVFSAEVCPLLIPFLKRENVAVNGTFEDARFVLEGEELQVYLTHGGVNILQTTGADRQLQQIIRRQYGRAAPAQSADSKIACS